MKRHALALHLPQDLVDELRRIGEVDESKIDESKIEEFVKVAVEEKLADLRTIRRFREQAPWRCVPGIRRRSRRSRSAPHS